MYRGQNQYHVVMEVAPEYWQSAESLNQVYVRSPQGQEVPLKAFAKWAPATAPLAVNHQGLFPAITISFNLAPGVALGDAVRAINEAAARVGLPDTIHTMFTGTAQAYQESLGSQPVLIATALATVFIVLGILYESYIHPITILSTIPSAGAGALLALLITGTELTVIAMIGIILLIGIVKKNAIMMVDFALAAERQDGKSPRDAIFEASLLRFRPILMTTMAAMLGACRWRSGSGRDQTPASPRYRHHRRPDGESDAHAVHDAVGASISIGCSTGGNVDDQRHASGCHGQESVMRQSRQRRVTVLPRDAWWDQCTVLPSRGHRRSKNAAQGWKRGTE
jgi:multidrug efflux pump subunit AcrB